MSDLDPAPATEAPTVSWGSVKDGVRARDNTQGSCRRDSGHQTEGACNDSHEKGGGKGVDKKQPTLKNLFTKPCSKRDGSYELPARQHLDGVRRKKSLNPHPVVRQTRWRFFSGWIIHVPALLLTIGVTILSQARLFWYPHSGVQNRRVDLTADDLNNFLQLPAKLHEILIVASLSAIGLNIFRRRLIGDGVRLGFLTGGYRVGDLEYLISPAFWRQGFAGFSSWDILLAAYFVFATMLSALVGPASAILLIPTPGWYPLNHDLAFDNITLPLIYPAKPKSVWPAFFSPDQSPWADQPPFDPIDWDKCKGPQGTYQRHCPAGGFSEIWTWAQSFGSNNLQGNLTFQSPIIQRNLMLTYSNRSTTIATTPSRFFVSSVGLFDNYIQGNPVGRISRGVHYKLEPSGGHPKGSQLDQPIYQPLVQSKCAVYDRNKPLSGQPLYYPTAYLNCFKDSLCQQHKNQNRSFVFQSLNQSQWMKTPPTFRTQGIGSSVINIAGQVPGTTNNTQNDWLYGCSLLASWIASNYTLDPWLSRTVQSTVNSPVGMQDIIARDTLQDGYVIRFNETWIPFLDPKINVTGEDGLPQPTTAILRLLDLFATTKNIDGTTQTVLAPVEANNITAAEILLEKLFAVYLTDSLARTGSHVDPYLILQKNDTQIMSIDLLAQHGYFGGVNIVDSFNETHSRWRRQNTTTYPNQTIKDITAGLYSGYLKFDFEAEQYGYGSGDPRTTLRFAVAVMFIYLATLTGYALVIACAHVLEHYDIKWKGQPVRVWSVKPWGNLEDLSVLALRSQPPADENLTSSGRDAKPGRVWHRVVKVRVDDQQNLHLVVDESVPMQKVHHAGSGMYF
ncbi:hypothetical protein CT0861_07263 [Colletotrichum tofieldiae]|uniref:Uncharacterized protein n=1 Tax=Colletotrichum tofieldiae TaxID=708197 RepID=A0A166NZI5_9PEZI|nr:hypothetical protein CT0861_07263 [Colletotrichum tofieldiae]